MSDKMPKKYVWFLVFAVVALILMNSAFWFTRNIFNPDKFASIAREGIINDSSLDALSAGITAKIFEGRPVAQNVFQDPVNKMVSGLLRSNLATQVFERTISRTQNLLTTKNPEPVEINLVPIKDAIVRINSVVEQPVDISTIPDTVTIFDQVHIPNIYNLGTTLLWVGPIALLLAIFLLGFPLLRSRQDSGLLRKVLLWESIAVFIGFIISLLIGPLFKPQLLVNVSDANAKQLVSNIYDAFVKSFDHQTWILFILAAAFIILRIFITQNGERKIL